jgi:glycosyltransferase involved in cell wall biosynthesis
VKRVLFIQHTNAISGSAMSLLYTAQGLDRRKYVPVVALTRPSAAVTSLYANAGIETVSAEGITSYRHTTGGWFGYRNPLDYWGRAKQRLRVRAGIRATNELVQRTQPDLVHLNSVTLLPSAMALAALGTPFVWHVREAPVQGWFGRRRQWIGRHLLSLPGSLVFLSDYDRRAWTGRDDAGAVIPNFVDFGVFDYRLDGAQARGALGCGPDAPVVLYMGGFSRIKGIHVLIPAIARLKKHLPTVRCVIPSGVTAPPTDRLVRLARRVLPAVGSGTFAQRVARDIARLGVGENLILLPPDPDAARLYAAADVVVFPSVEPHFARPVIEAGAMAKAVVASRIGGVTDLVRNGITGTLVTPGAPVELADALCGLLEDPGARGGMGRAGLEQARSRFDRDTNMRRIENVYEETIQGAGAGPRLHALQPR